MIMEIWKDIDGYDGYYQVSNYGRIKNANKGTYLKQQTNRFGYKRVKLFKNNKGKEYAVHRLVALAFIENPENKPCVNHINFDKTCNIAENLEWCTYEENNKWSMVNGRKAMRPEWLEKICKTRKTKAVVGTNIKTGEKVYFKSIRATKEIGADPSDVSRCCRGLKESSGGYRWSLLKAEE
jgi:hypothetical protein